MTTTVKTPATYTMFVMHDVNGQAAAPFPIHFRAASNHIAAWVTMAMTGNRALCEREDGKTITVASMATCTPENVHRFTALALGLPSSEPEPNRTYARRNAFAIRHAIQTMRPGTPRPLNAANPYELHPVWIMTKNIAAGMLWALHDRVPNHHQPHQ